MTPRETNDYRQTLKALRKELVGSLPGRDAILIENAPDALDQTQSATERDMAVETLNRHSARLRQVDAALDRLADGSYGICLECEEEIGARRLKALPWAEYCISCQQRRDTRMVAQGSHWWHQTDDFPAAA